MFISPLSDVDLQCLLSGAASHETDREIFFSSFYVLRPAPPGHECPGYVGNEKPAEAGSEVRAAPSRSRVHPAFRFNRSPGIPARAGRALVIGQSRAHTARSLPARDVSKPRSLWRYLKAPSDL